jgi:16S rRNA (cytosine1402-N4)-methyltransferase
MTGEGVRRDGTSHEPVMVSEVLRYLAPRPGGRYLDLTVGGGGHARAILERIGPAGLLVGVDRDGEVLRSTSAELGRFHPNTRFFHANFAEIGELRRQIGPIQFDGLLLDLGTSSIQIDDGERGFSFLRPGPLDMRMDRTEGVTAADLLKRLPVDELEEIFRTYGEERHARRIARAIVRERDRRPITDTLGLAALIERTVPSRRGRIHPATRTFQALRIAVNDELNCLERFLAGYGSLLSPRGVAAVISFHSLEDRLVKQAFRRDARAGAVELLTRKPVRPGEDEVRRNPRSRSARLRAAKRTGREVDPGEDGDDAATTDHPGGAGGGDGGIRGG